MVAEAILNAVRNAEPVEGFPAYRSNLK